MSSPSLALPRGLIPGACFAVLLAVPLFLAISLDSASSAFSGRFRFGGAHSAHQRPASSMAEFFDHQVGVRVFVGFRPSTPSTSADRISNSFGAPEKATSARTRPQKTLQILVENRSDKDLSVSVLEAKSEFGDLSSGLQTIRLAPGQVSQTGMSLKESAVPTKPSPVHVTLRLGDREEKRTLVLAPLVPL